MIDDFGFGFHQAQIGKLPDMGKVLRGFGAADVIELKANAPEGTFRAVYTVRFEDVVIVLHAFQKKSKTGDETPKKDEELIHSRLKLAKEIHKEWKLKNE